MKQFNTIMQFEYMGYLKSRPFQITTIILVLIILIAGFMPQLSGIVTSFFDDDDGEGESGATNAAYIISDEAKDEPISDLITTEIMNQSIDSYTWEKETGNPESVSKDYSITLYYKGNLKYDYYASGHDLSAAYATEEINLVLKTLAQQIEISELPADVQDEVNGILSLTPESNLIQTGGDAEQNFWLGYVLIFLLYMVIIMYGQFVVTSVVTEKSSKAMELLVTSANSNSLMFGKVVGVGLAALTQLVLIFGAAALIININKGQWEEFMPIVFGILESSPLSFNLILYFILFFVFGYFLYAFMYAALGSTVSKMEDASSVITLPMLLVIAAFLISMIGLGNIDSLFVKVCSFIPFFSPMLMFSRICMGAVGTMEIIISLAILLVSILLMGWLAAKIYRIGVLMYGQKMGLRSIIKTVKNS